MAALCAGCGREITDAQEQPSLCAECEEKIQQADMAWKQKEEVQIESDRI